MFHGRIIDRDRSEDWRASTHPNHKVADTITIGWWLETGITGMQRCFEAEKGAKWKGQNVFVFFSIVLHNCVYQGQPLMSLPGRHGCVYSSPAVVRLQHSSCPTSRFLVTWATRTTGVSSPKLQGLSVFSPHDTTSPLCLVSHTFPPCSHTAGTLCCRATPTGPENMWL